VDPDGFSYLYRRRLPPPLRATAAGALTDRGIQSRSTAFNRCLNNFTLAPYLFDNYRKGMKLQQGQIWKCGEGFVRIVHLERLEVAYKSFKSLKSGAGKHQVTSKKDFCRMLKGATLLTGKPAVITSPRTGQN
jgi:hypothetical protein